MRPPSSYAVIMAPRVSCLLRRSWLYVRRIPRALDCQQSLLIVSKARQERLRNGHATVTRRAKITGSQIGSALAPHWLSLIQTLGSVVSKHKCILRGMHDDADVATDHVSISSTYNKGMKKTEHILVISGRENEKEARKQKSQEGMQPESSSTAETCALQDRGNQIRWRYAELIPCVIAPLLREERVSNLHVPRTWWRREASDGCCRLVVDAAQL